MKEEITNPYIDRWGNPYDCETSFPAGGGLHKECKFNDDALYAYYIVADRKKIEEYLNSKHFQRVEFHKDWERWIKGNTQIDFEDYDKLGHLWGYMHTEVI